MDQIKAIRAEIDKIQADWKSRPNENMASIGSDEVAKIVSSWTGIPVLKLTQEESEKLLHLEEELHKRVIGQDEAVSAVAKAIRRARAGLKDPNKPIGSFIFVGPTGVGKTELSKALAQAMFGDDKLMIRLDMSEFMEKHAVSKIIGAPPDTWDLTNRAANSPKRYAANRTAWCSSTRSRRRIPTYSISCCRSSTTAV